MDFSFNLPILWIVFLLVLIILFLHLPNIIVIFGLNILCQHLCILVCVCYILFWRLLVVHNSKLGFVWCLLHKLVGVIIDCKDILCNQAVPFLFFHIMCPTLFTSILSCPMNRNYVSIPHNSFYLYSPSYFSFLILCKFVEFFKAFTLMVCHRSNQQIFVFLFGNCVVIWNCMHF